MTAKRLLELLPLAGVSIDLKPDGRLAARGPSAILDAVALQLRAVGRDAIRAELQLQHEAARQRVERLLSGRSIQLVEDDDRGEAWEPPDRGSAA